MENMDKLSKEDIQEYIDLYERQKKADPSHAANYDSDIDRMNRLLQTTSKQRENAGDYSADDIDFQLLPWLNYQLVIWNTESVFLRKEKMIRFSG